MRIRAFGLRAAALGLGQLRGLGQALLILCPSRGSFKDSFQSLSKDVIGVFRAGGATTTGGSSECPQCNSTSQSQAQKAFPTSRYILNPKPCLLLIKTRGHRGADSQRRSRYRRSLGLSTGTGWEKRLGDYVWGLELMLEFCSHGYTQRAQYPLIRQYTLNYNGLHLMI